MNEIKANSVSKISAFFLSKLEEKSTFRASKLNISQSSEQLWRVLLANVLCRGRISCIRLPSSSVHVNPLENERIQGISDWRLKLSSSQSIKQKYLNLSIAQVLFDHGLSDFNEQVVIPAKWKWIDSGRYPDEDNLAAFSWTACSRPGS